METPPPILTSLSPAAFFARLERLLDSAGHKVEGGSAFHDHRLALVVGENEGGRMVRRIVAPPALPRVVRPRAAHGTEHVAAEDEGAEVVHRPVGEFIVDIRWIRPPGRAWRGRS